ncbi:DNA polymerase III subunit gamma/tau [Pseudomonas kielensis]|uniref:DNA polymerase III subunit gamma/tau n=1 Tax=Pseudomonas kielensis TaxID=2762577 RepID=A0A7X1GBY3_9PSED|nr:DNA polymerase III subunit gamma/tau [Pseudomonas kielensis]MBC2689609.1 DNA polymerase III subunit gamma/tau [Pseudomonas kielensis]UZM16192.1 DNA polymerase III subunit gamma/tau [Pseudomonas kielensis]WKL51593.1 DNA polymerase III subunit gamma/tau [Pseudomonas kielensis]
MSYQVLARKWRPRSFREMVGQTHVLKALINALDSQRLHHAYLFTGTRGVGKTTIARIIAKCLNCETGITSTPCGTCSVCREIDEGRFVDLIEIDAASRTKVEDTRELLDNVQYAPSRGRFKVYLIDEVHMLSSHSFNALLKTLEEPPPYVKFILATTDPQKLPATILSRCLQFSLKNMTPERVVEHLTHVLGVENVPFEDDALWLLGRAADGSMRDAMSLTDQAIAFGEGKVMAADVRAMLGTLDHGQVYDVLHALIEGDAKALLEGVRHLAEQGPDWNGVLSEILNVLHRVAIAQALPEGVDNGQGDRDRVLALAQALPAEDVQFYYQMGLIGRRDLPLAPDPRGGFEMVLLRMLAFRPADTADAPRQPLKPVGISQATVDSAHSVAGALPVAPVVAAAPIVAAPAPTPAPVAPVVEPEPEVYVAPEPAAVVEEVVDLPWNDPVEPAAELQPAVEPVLETVAEQPDLTPMPVPVPDSVVPDAPEWAAAPIPEPSVAEVDAATPDMDLDDEPPLDEDYIEPDMDSAYSYLDELASEHTAEPAPAPEPEPAAMPATGLALQWLELFPKLPISGMTGSIAANCTLIAVDGDQWLLHLDPAHSALFNATQQRRLNDALNQLLERTLTVSIELIKPEQETPAQASSRRRANRQREAEDSIHGDPFIQQMMQQFGAVIRNDTIEPVEALVSQG